MSRWLDDSVHAVDMNCKHFRFNGFVFRVVGDKERSPEHKVPGSGCIARL